jgi:rhodanese-related sulfurtransferase
MAVQSIEFFTLRHSLREGRPGMSLPEFKRLVDEAKSQIQEIGPGELKQMLGADEDFSLIDVREPDEHAKGTIAGAVPIPRGILEREIDKVTTDKSRKIVLYCAGGSRSALAALSLKKMGFGNVISLAGGYGGWREAQSK